MAEVDLLTPWAQWTYTGLLLLIFSSIKFETFSPQSFKLQVAWSSVLIFKTVNLFSSCGIFLFGDNMHTIAFIPIFDNSSSCNAGFKFP